MPKATKKRTVGQIPVKGSRNDNALRPSVIDLINTPSIRTKIAAALGQTEMSIVNYIQRNDRKLTLHAVLEVIKIETGLTESEILEPQTAQANA